MHGRGGTLTVFFKDAEKIFLIHHIACACACVVVRGCHWCLSEVMQRFTFGFKPQDHEGHGVQTLFARP